MEKVENGLKLEGKNNMQQRIINAAWELFYEKGYEQTTIMDILQKSGVAKGSFYYHFKSKETLLNTLSVVFDNCYIDLEKKMPEDMDSFEKLLYLNYEMHDFIEKRVSCDLIGRLYSAQINRSEGSSLLDYNRYYFQLISRIVEEGKQRGEIIADVPTREIVKYYSMSERAIVTDWCMNKGRYSLADKSRDYMRRMMWTFKAEEK